MNNGLTGEGARRKAQRIAIFGQPKERAKLIGTYHGVSEWSYRGKTLFGRRNGGWNAGWHWYAEGFADAPTAPTRMTLMARVDALLDSPNIAHDQRAASAQTNPSHE